MVVAATQEDCFGRRAGSRSPSGLLLRWREALRQQARRAVSSRAQARSVCRPSGAPSCQPAVSAPRERGFAYARDLLPRRGRRRTSGASQGALRSRAPRSTPSGGSFGPARGRRPVERSSAGRRRARRRRLLHRGAGAQAAVAVAERSLRDAGRALSCVAAASPKIRVCASPDRCRPGGNSSAGFRTFSCRSPASVCLPSTPSFEGTC